ncbi:MAG: DUF1593 domain-containing protein [Bacteroidales bacterium]|nr:DUF1593 domain-containing protein [Bacteroidales bacterium]
MSRILSKCATTGRYHVGSPPLGAVYPRSGYQPDKPGMQEGDSPSFLYLVSAVNGDWWLYNYLAG